MSRHVGQLADKTRLALAGAGNGELPVTDMQTWKPRTKAETLALRRRNKRLAQVRRMYEALECNERIDATTEPDALAGYYDDDNGPRAA